MNRFDEQWKDAVLREARRIGAPAPTFASDGDRGSSAIVWDDGPRNMHGIWIIDPEYPADGPGCRESTSRPSRMNDR